MDVLHFFPLDSFCKSLMAGGDQTLAILKANCVLIMAIFTGTQCRILGCHRNGRL